jgi:predicted metal-dependent hydrolase
MFHIMSSDPTQTSSSGAAAGYPANPQYLGFFEQFNRQKFFEAHEVLEGLWLQKRGEPEANFFKGLIQLAGAFVHVQNRRREPALSLLNMAKTNLQKYPPVHLGLDLGKVLELISLWEMKIKLSEGNMVPDLAGVEPVLRLLHA